MMAKTFLAVLVLLLAAVPVQAQLPAAVDGEPLPTLAPMLERTVPAVVNVATRALVVEPVSPLFDDPFFRRFFDLPSQQRERIRQGLGSGVVVDAGQGLILTNNHVIQRADEIVVTLHDGRRYDAEVIGADRETDIALIRIEADRLQALPFADSDALRVGDFVVAIGNPFGLGQTVTSGIVSALGRSGLGVEGFEDFIQTDASINPGNSGGALVNLRGELVGINTAILARGGGNIGIGFAIPINMARQVQEHLIADGAVTRGQLGIAVQDLTPDLAQAFSLQVSSGAVVTRVEPGSPADRAGLRSGDVVLETDGRPVRNATDLRNRIGLLRVGTEVRLRVLRNGREQFVVARIEAPQRQEIDGASIDARLAGAQFARMLQRDGEPRIAISAVEPRSAAARAGLREGDVVLSINRREVSELDDLRTAAQAGRGGLLLNIQRGDGAFFLMLQ
ncbi:DegQ family serine endoprotease [Thioalkalivibrio paradoxus]|uniref:Peptidase n=1 Tax=Thioalkalivibrio paradoxus ARh 1 TaxID=713585 RepID=W0DJX6_9GAMM|nr:DegQ family serine endoprotease [Thioalkalivibrio paradoxus]AHE97170.1 peptidase [Thioalkalivibrio paradoxus ARh 1]